MRIEMAYRNGRVDVFDTMSFTAPSPLGKENALTNFELRFDELGKTGLWLAAHHYDVDPSGTEDCPDDETPIARRRRGWRFLLAEASELDELEWVAVDGEVACFAATSSRTGASIWQGPHHVAQKSTSTGLSDSSTSCLNVASVT